MIISHHHPNTHSTEISHPVFGSWEDTKIIKYSSLYTTHHSVTKIQDTSTFFWIDTLSLLRTFWYGSLFAISPFNAKILTCIFKLTFPVSHFWFSSSYFYLLRILVTQSGFFFPPLKSFMVLWNHSLAHLPDGRANISTCWVSFSLKTKR